MNKLVLTASVLMIGMAALSGVHEKQANSGEDRGIVTFPDHFFDVERDKVSSATFAAGGVPGFGGKKDLLSRASVQPFLGSEAGATETGGVPAGGHEFRVARTIIPLDAMSGPSRPGSTAGGLIAADVNDDGARDLLVTMPGYIGAYGTDGSRLWSKRIDVRVGGKAEKEGLPGHHGPGVQAGDLDGDGRTEVIFLDQDSTLHVLQGSDGKKLWSSRLAPPPSAERWEHVVVANFRGRGDRDLLLQATANDDYRMGKHVAAYAVETLREGKDEPLWRRDDFLACAHNGARVADMDGDGRDEIMGGGVILGPGGEERIRIAVEGHIDSVFIEDVRPDLPGLEVVLLEEGARNRIFLAGISEVIWTASHKRQEPQNAAVGRFLPDRPERQIWCRSRYDRHQKPFVLDARGKLLSEYEMDAVAPDGWTTKGVEVIHAIDWDGGELQYACAKERHTSGDVGLFDPLSGRFLLRLPDKADRLYVADVVGDWREEIIVRSGNELHLYRNPLPPRRQRERLWSLPHYRRNKMTWNYYSP